ncbi:Postreplication repair E3 ubiquitin-protein ligase rad18 [Cyphellophora attinorum]|uniref:Postreplication repair E3 ubiquitin-protein ligase RAD18 n=1 Tax=Cyphellophora attinorum TaxID=1664694 RepID=A0A0N1NYC1_9EURO|nr:Postreplication repair E3 ubiquitin-protein ligase rad18 [Phialophora attinorum]KPI38686.1 Postreplication repair E3 ubiquitin-protein ligase rad18 [Phialophora attinorum]
MSTSIDPNAVTDSTDWLQTPLPCLAPLESSLRCQVCKEVFTTPMITSCSHTFCSLCIRRYLSQEGKCPSCRTPDQEMKLRHNWAVQELVEIWSESREKIFAFAKNAADDQPREVEEGERPKKRRKLDEKPIIVQKSGLSERRSTRSQSRRTASHASQSIASLPSTQEEVADSEDGGSVYAVSPKVDSRHIQQPAAEPNDGLVGCPNCTRRMKEALINTHLDKCLQGLAGSPTPPPRTPSAQRNHAPSPSHGLQAGTIAYTTTKPTTTSTLQRLPAMNYGTLNENALRRKLKDLGIPNHGNKELMRRRHTEWMNLWNANCDSLQPIPKMKLLRELDVWERNHSRDERQRQQMGATGNGNGGGVMEKEFDREGYMRKQKDGFEDLVKKARESRMAKAAAAATATPDEPFAAAGSTLVNGSGPTEEATTLEDKPSVSSNAADAPPLAPAAPVEHPVGPMLNGLHPSHMQDHHPYEQEWQLSRPQSSQT